MTTTETATGAREPTPRKTIPPWARRTIYTLGAVVGAMTLAASGFELYSLARNAGFSWPVSAVLPVALDAGAALSAVLWVVGDDSSPHRRQGKVTALALVAVSSLANGTSVLADPKHRILSDAAVVVTAVIVAVAFPPIAARAVHLILVVRDFTPAPVTEQARSPSAAPEVHADVAVHTPATPECSPAALAPRRRLRAAPALVTPRRATTALRPRGGATAVQRPDTAPQAADGDAPAKDKARTWYLEQRRLGEVPTAADVNRAVGTSKTYIRKPDLAEWDADLPARRNGHPVSA